MLTASQWQKWCFTQVCSSKNTLVEAHSGLWLETGSKRLETSPAMERAQLVQWRPCKCYSITHQTAKFYALKLNFFRLDCPCLSELRSWLTWPQFQFSYSKLKDSLSSDKDPGWISCCISVTHSIYAVPCSMQAQPWTSTREAGRTLKAEEVEGNNAFSM